MAEVWDESDSAFVIGMVFNTEDRAIEGRFIVLPSGVSADSDTESAPGRAS